jgi:hypothetical protein
MKKLRQKAKNKLLIMQAKSQRTTQRMLDSQQPVDHLINFDNNVEKDDTLNNNSVDYLTNPDINHHSEFSELPLNDSRGLLQQKGLSTPLAHSLSLDYELKLNISIGKVKLLSNFKVDCTFDFI